MIISFLKMVTKSRNKSTQCLTREKKKRDFIIFSCDRSAADVFFSEVRSEGLELLTRCSPCLRSLLSQWSAECQRGRSRTWWAVPGTCVPARYTKTQQHSQKTADTHIMWGGTIHGFCSFLLSSSKYFRALNSCQSKVYMEFLKKKKHFKCKWII